MRINLEPCPHCRSLYGHSHDCESGTIEARIERWKRWGEYFIGKSDRLERVIKRQNELAQMWQGKYAIVKHENNKLRQRLWYQRRRDTEELK